MESQGHPVFSLPNIPNKIRGHATEPDFLHRGKDLAPRLHDKCLLEDRYEGKPW